MFTPWNAKLIPLGRSRYLLGNAYFIGAKPISPGQHPQLSLNSGF